MTTPTPISGSATEEPSDDATLLAKAVRAVEEYAQSWANRQGNEAQARVAERRANELWSLALDLRTLATDRPSAPEELGDDSDDNEAYWRDAPSDHVATTLRLIAERLPWAHTAIVLKEASTRLASRPSATEEPSTLTLRDRDLLAAIDRHLMQLAIWASQRNQHDYARQVEDNAAALLALACRPSLRPRAALTVAGAEDTAEEEDALLSGRIACAGERDAAKKDGRLEDAHVWEKAVQRLELMRAARAAGGK